MSVAYRVSNDGEMCTVRVVNGFQLDMNKCKGSFTVTKDIAKDPAMLEKCVREFAIDELGMNPKAVHIWECNDLGDKQ